MTQFLLSFFLILSTPALASANLTQRVRTANREARAKNDKKVVELLNPYTDQLDSHAFLLLAKSYSNLKDYKNEVRVLDLLVSKDKENFRWHVLLAEAYRKRATQIDREHFPFEYDGLITSAVQEFRRALQLNPRYKPAFTELLTTLLQHHDDAEARDLVLTGINQFGNLPRLLNERCRLDSVGGFVVQAVKHCREAIKASPRYPDNYAYLIQSLHDRGEDQAGQRAAVSATKRFPKSEFLQWAAGKLFMTKGIKNYPVATRYFRAALAAKRDSGRAHFGLAEALYNGGHQKEALEHYVYACKKAKNAERRIVVDAFFVAGSTLKQSGEMSLGTTYAHKAQLCHDSN